MTPQPPPCQHCGRARLQTGLCPHCEHIQCHFCSDFMSIIEYADHAWCHRFRYQSGPRSAAMLFWWEITTAWPQRCPDCGLILDVYGRCPKAPTRPHRRDIYGTADYPSGGDDIPWG